MNSNPSVNQPFEPLQWQLINQTVSPTALKVSPSPILLKNCSIRSITESGFLAFLTYLLFQEVSTPFS